MRRHLLVLSLLALLPACYRYVPAVNPTPESIAHEGSIRIATSEGRQFELGRIAVRGDTLFGERERLIMGTRRESVALADIREVRVRRFDTTRSVIAGAAAVAFVAGTVVFIDMLASWKPGPLVTCCH